MYGVKAGAEETGNVDVVASGSGPLFCIKGCISHSLFKSDLVRGNLQISPKHDRVYWSRTVPV